MSCTPLSSRPSCRMLRTWVSKSIDLHPAKSNLLMFEQGDISAVSSRRMDFLRSSLCTLSENSPFCKKHQLTCHQRSVTRNPKAYTRHCSLGVCNAASCDRTAASTVRKLRRIRMKAKAPCTKAIKTRWSSRNTADFRPVSSSLDGPITGGNTKDSPKLFAV